VVASLSTSLLAVASGRWSAGLVHIAKQQQEQQQQKNESRSMLKTKDLGNKLAAARALSAAAFDTIFFLFFFAD